VPLVVRHPREPRPGRTETFFTQNIDLAATILELAGAPPAASDGISFAQLLDGRQASWPRQELLTECWGPPAHGEPPRTHAAVRTLRWKYAEVYDDEERQQIHTRADGRQEVELYDLERDPYELDNLALLADAPARGYAAAELETVIADLKARLVRLEAQ
jgi:arylsulfatase A-like enzyme